MENHQHIYSNLALHIHWYLIVILIGIIWKTKENGKFVEKEWFHWQFLWKLLSTVVYSIKCQYRDFIQGRVCIIFLKHISKEKKIILSALVSVRMWRQKNLGANFKKQDVWIKKVFTFRLNILQHFPCHCHNFCFFLLYNI